LAVACFRKRQTKEDTDEKWLILLAAVPLAVLLGDQLLARAAPDRFAADLTMKQGRASATGDTVDWLPERHFRVERERTRRGWTSTLKTTDVGTGTGDEIVGIVDSGDDEPAQLIDNKGRRRAVPADDDVRAMLGGQNHRDEPVADSAKALRHKSAAEAR
jgi:hypothetical protein